jgi:hypothetical protein
MKAYYAGSDVAPVVVEKAADDALVMTSTRTTSTTSPKAAR